MTQTKTRTDDRRFKTRAAYLEFCRTERTRLQQEQRAWVQLIRVPVVQHVNSTYVLKMSVEEIAANGTHLHPVGAVAIWSTTQRQYGRDTIWGPDHLLVGASCCNPKEQRKFDRHEAAYRALRNCVVVPFNLDPEAATEVPRKIMFSEPYDNMARFNFYLAFPRSARELVRSMLLTIRDQRHKQIVEAATPQA